MKNHPWVIGLVALSLATGGCDKLGIGKDDKAGKASDSSVASTDSKSDKDKDKKGDKGDKSAKGDTSAKADDKGAVPPGAGAGAPATAGSALTHLSDDCQVAVHLDLSQLVANPSFQREIVPGLDDILATSSKDKEFSKFQSFLKDNNLDYKKSFHDVAVCVTDIKDAEHAWSVVIGTDMKPETLAPALGKEAKDGKVEDLDGHKVFIKDNVTIGQADGVVIIAATKAVFQKSTAAKAASAYTLDASKYLAFVVREQATTMLLAMGDPKKSEPFKAIKKVTGVSDLSTLKTEMVADCGTPEDAKKLDSLVTLMKDELVKKAAGNPGADALKTLASHTDGSNVVIDLTTPQDAFDQALKMVGAQLKDAKAKL